jgi:predicted RNase H-like nuclease
VAAIGSFSADRLTGVELVARGAFAEILVATRNCAVVAVDMPIGLLNEPEQGGRECDREARGFLGWPRASSVFSAPSRAVLEARTFDGVRGQGMTLQAFHILPKIREVDGAMTPALQERVVEYHPEVAFKSLAGRAMEKPKRRVAGRNERLEVLRRFDARLAEVMGGAIDSGDSGIVRMPKDDVIDALVLVIGAWRKLKGEAETLPARPAKGAKGLRMEIWR